MYPFQENSALCDQVDSVQESTTKLLRERKLLIKRLQRYEPDSVFPLEGSSSSSVEKRSAARKKSQTMEPKRPQKHPVDPRAPNSLEPYTKAKVKIEQPSVKLEFNEEDEQDTVEVEVDSFVKDEPLPSTATGTSYAIDSLVIQSLGEIYPHKLSFHTDRWIYPIGFTSIRLFGSMRDPFQKSVYTCRITEVAGNPRFEMNSEADPEVMIVGPSTQFCHMTLLQHLRETHGLEQLATVEPNGDWFFGLAHPVVMSLMKGMPNFRACAKFKDFEKCHEAAITEMENDPGINFEAFLKLISQPSMFIFNHEEELKHEEVDQ